MTEWPIIRTRLPTFKLDTFGQSQCKPFCKFCIWVLVSSFEVFYQLERVSDKVRSKWLYYNCNLCRYQNLRTTKIGIGILWNARTERKCRRAVMGKWALVTRWCRCSRSVAWETAPYLTSVTNNQPRHGYSQKNSIFIVQQVLKMPKSVHSRVRESSLN